MATFELWEIDAWADGEGGWTWNDKFRLGQPFTSDTDDLKGLFRRKLKEARGRPLPNGVFRIDDSDWNTLEVKRRKDDCPVWAMMRISHER